jgi:lysophospholipase L1-like esterase
MQLVRCAWIAALCMSGAAHAERPAWVATWGASPQAADEPQKMQGATIREMAQVSVGGKQVRIRLSNAYGSGPITVGATHLARRARGVRIAAGSDRAVTFHGQRSVTIPAGGLEVSDPVELELADLETVAISLYVPGEVALQTEHGTAMATTYLSPPGDFTASAEFKPAATTDATYLATDLEVVRPGARALVVLGDSLTDGVGSTADADRRWTNDLARRLIAAADLPRTAVINEGIAGNRLLHDFLATSAIARLDRDVLVKAGVHFVAVVEGLNDIGIPGGFGRPSEQVSAEDIIAAQSQIVERAHAVGLVVIGATLTPCEGAKVAAGYATPAGEAKRQAVNQWIRTSGAFDAVVDFDATVRDPQHPTRLRAAFDSGDHLHPNDAGYQAMAAAVPLQVFR